LDHLLGSPSLPESEFSGDATQNSANFCASISALMALAAILVIGVIWGDI